MRNALIALLVISAALFAAGNTQPPSSSVVNQPVNVPVPPPCAMDNQPVTVPMPPSNAMDNQPVSNPIPPPAAMDNQPVMVPLPPGNSMNNQPHPAPVRPSGSGLPRSDPQPPAPLLPLDGDTTVAPRPLLRVESYPGGFVMYNFCIWQGPNKVAEQYSILPAWYVANGNSIFECGASYTWSCRVYSRGLWSDWFYPRWSFSIGWPSPAPTPLTPLNGSRIAHLTPLLSVVPNMLARSYTFQITDVANGNTFTKVNRTPFWLVPRGAGMLQFGHSYTWSCRVDNGTGNSNWFRPSWGFLITNPEDDIQSADAPGNLEFTCRAWPNPFSEQTAVSYTLPRATDVTVTFYTVGGRKVREFALGSQAAGSHALVWNGTDEQSRRVTAGVYIYRLKTGEKEKVERLIRTQ
jgi:hypothetical protein